MGLLDHMQEAKPERFYLKEELEEFLKERQVDTDTAEI